ncbi:hypothetical protein CYY_003339 [Polysphondylium violaceum]|uniref:Uncharacterized protein n=1 Tax=Polysphondylium violaceum TaxID=133409 RepID=A0A8J4PUX3_9MYCE|nr:hypothetical protein CYY_003339 [Polysphondylium violaceum]
MTGTQCKSNSDCPNQRICKGGFCWKKTCYDDLNCPLGEYCSETNICAPKLVDGSTCLEYTNCKYTKTCTYNKKSTKTCMPAFSVKEGGKCDPALFDPTDSKTLLSYDCDIGKGLFCDKDGICKKYKQKNTNCTEDSSICNPIEQCGCASNGQDSVCIPSIHLNQVCKERLNDLWTCVVKNDHLLFPESIYSPMYDSCGSQVCKVVEKCFIDLPSNSLLQYCNIDPTLVREPYSSSSSLIQSEEEQNHSKSTTSAPLQHSESHNLSSDNPSPVESSTNTNNTTTQKPIKDVQNNSSMKISLNYYFLLSLLMIVITII